MSTSKISSSHLKDNVDAHIASTEYKKYCQDIVNNANLKTASKIVTVNMDNKFGYIVNNTTVKVNMHPQYSNITDTYSGNVMEYE